MKRPFLIRHAPLIMRSWLWSRFFRAGFQRKLNLYDSAPLHFAPKLEMRLLPGDCISDSIAFTGVYELSLSRRLVALSRDTATSGGLLIDIGANLGYFSLLWAGQCKENRVVAFEAAPRVFELLSHNVFRNKLDSRIQVHALAVGRQNGYSSFDPGPKEQTGWGGLTNKLNARTVELPLRRLDAVLNGNDKIKVLKIDVEGAEAWVLEGAESLLRDKIISNIFFECNLPRMRLLGIPPDRPLKLLDSFGYKVRSLGGSKNFGEYHATPR